MRIFGEVPNPQRKLPQPLGEVEVSAFASVKDSLVEINPDAKPEPA